MNILLVGITGHMGKTLYDLVKDTDDKIVSGIALEKENWDIPIYTNFDDIKEDMDVIIDFSVPDNIYPLLKFAIKKGKAVVIATTGYNDEELEYIKEASKEIPILLSGNMSLGINLMKDLVKTMAKVLNNFDIEIVEAHHNLKKDSPSGTANMLLKSIEDARDVNNIYYGRHGRDTLREENDIGIHSIRAGSIVGEHKVIFAGMDEILEIKHTALSKKIFALGALKASNFVIGKEPGLYSMDDVINN